MICKEHVTSVSGEHRLVDQVHLLVNRLVDLTCWFFPEGACVCRFVGPGLGPPPGVIVAFVISMNSDPRLMVVKQLWYIV